MVRPMPNLSFLVLSWIGSSHIGSWLIGRFSFRCINSTLFNLDILLSLNTSVTEIQILFGKYLTYPCMFPSKICSPKYQSVTEKTEKHVFFIYLCRQAISFSRLEQKIWDLVRCQHWSKFLCNQQKYTRIDLASRGSIDLFRDRCRRHFYGPRNDPHHHHCFGYCFGERGLFAFFLGLSNFASPNPRRDACFC